MTRWTGMMMTALVGCILWSGCSSQSAQTQITQTPNELDTLERLHAQIDGQPQYRRSLRKPVRERQARTRRALERECDRLLSQGRDAVRAEALTGDNLSTAGEDYLAALTDMKASARSGNRRSMHNSYHRVRSAHAALATHPED